MQNTLKFALIVILLIYLFVILKSVKRKNLRINYLIFDLTRLITKEQNKNTMLIQEISLLKRRIDKIEKNNNN